MTAVKTKAKKDNKEECPSKKVKLATALQTIVEDDSDWLMHVGAFQLSTIYNLFCNQLTNIANTIMTYIILLIAQAFYYEDVNQDSNTDHWFHKQMSIIMTYVGLILDQYMVHIILLCTFQPLLIFIFDRNQQH